ncbi:ABC transporter permease [Aureimonas mangrovi]|uniref:ABC transporter permease n=1 Tax=Aureimonas mangrovi TaxID=2758041 RepID=UPI00163DB8FC|nr:ABC transporter permease [Aureimonas mangrovi]
MSTLPPPATAQARPGPAGLIFLGFWALCAVALAAYLLSRWDAALMARYTPVYLSGLWTTVSLVAISFALGALLSVPIAIGRRSSNPIARGTSFAYVSFFRGTPLIAQIFLVYYGFGSFRAAFEAVNLWWFFREAWYCAIFAISLNTAAYQAEILRGAVESVPRGQWEGGRSLGLPTPVILARIVFPQAMIVALRPYANEIILLVKASAIVAIITVFDLMGETRRAFGRTFDFQTYLWAAILYLALVETLRHATNFVERRITRHTQR